MHRRVLLGLGILVAAMACSRGTSDAPPTPPKPPSLATPRPPAPPGSGDFARRSFSTPLSPSDAEAVLRRTRIFEFGAMPPKRQVQAFNVLFEQPDAASRFRSIAEGAFPAGRLYALAGLLLLDRAEAQGLAASLSENSATIMVMDSDVGYDQPVRELARLIEQRHLGTSFRRIRNETNEYFARPRQ